MKQHAQQQHKPPAEPADQKGMQKGNRHTEQSQAHGGTKDSSEAVSYTHLTLPTNTVTCRSRWSPYH